MELRWLLCFLQELSLSLAGPFFVEHSRAMCMSVVRNCCAAFVTLRYSTVRMSSELQPQDERPLHIVPTARSATFGAECYRYLVTGYHTPDISFRLVQMTALYADHHFSLRIEFDRA